MTVYSGWVLQNSGTTQNLYDVNFINNTYGWAVGDFGTILKTTNGGLNWFNLTREQPIIYEAWIL